MHKHIRCILMEILKNLIITGKTWKSIKISQDLLQLYDKRNMLTVSRLYFQLRSWSAWRHGRKVPRGTWWASSRRCRGGTPSPLTRICTGMSTWCISYLNIRKKKLPSEKLTSQGCLGSVWEGRHPSLSFHCLYVLLLSSVRVWHLIRGVR